MYLHARIVHVIGLVVQRIEYLPAGKFPKLLMQVMFFVYAIKSKVDRRIYVGLSADISIRLIKHNWGKTKSTKGYTPWHLIYAESLPSRAEARNGEKYLKSGIGKEFLKSLAP